MTSKQSPTPQPGQPYVLEPAANEWLIGNRLVNRHLRFDDQGLQTVHWRLEAADFDFLQPLDADGRTAGEFAFSLDGQRYDGHSPMRLLGSATNPVPRGGLELRLRLALLESHCEFEVIYTVYEGFPAVRKRLRWTNFGAAPVLLGQVSFEAVNLEPGVPKRLELYGRYAAEDRELYFTGRVDDACVRLEDGASGLGFAVLNEAPGYLKRTSLMAWNPFWGARVRVGYDTDLFPFERRLAPGERFQSAGASVLLYQHFEGHTVTRYASDILSRRGRGFKAPVQYNTWPGFQWHIDEPTVLEQVPLAALMGAELFCVDEGWGEHVGANRVSARFPHGLEAIARAVETSGMRLGLWTSMAAVDAVTVPDLGWVARERDGSVKTTQTAEGQAVVMCLASAYWECATERIVALVQRYRLAYLKLDLTTIFNAYGESPGCHADGHDHAGWAESLGRTYEGIGFVCERIARDHPDVLLDLTFELWGHKHVIDYGLLSCGDLDWLANVGDLSADSGAPRQIRTLLYQRALAMPTERMLIGNLQAESGDPLPRVATTIASAPLLSGDLRKVTPEHATLYAQVLEWYKRLRDGQLLERFVGLGAWQAPSVQTWDGYARLALDGQGFLVAFRNESPETTFTPRLEVPDGVYTLHAVLHDFTLDVSAGDLQQGVPLGFSGDSRVALLQLRRR
jgi:alpha-galactosidase